MKSINSQERSSRQPTDSIETEKTDSSEKSFQEKISESHKKSKEWLKSHPEFTESILKDLKLESN